MEISITLDTSIPTTRELLLTINISLMLIVKSNSLIVGMEVSNVMPWLCVDHMIQQRVWPMGFSYPNPLAKSRPTGWDTK